MYSLSIFNSNCFIIFTNFYKKTLTTKVPNHVGNSEKLFFAKTPPDRGMFITKHNNTSEFKQCIFSFFVFFLSISTLSQVLIYFILQDYTKTSFYHLSAKLCNTKKTLKIIWKNLLFTAGVVYNRNEYTPNTKKSFVVLPAKFPGNDISTCDHLNFRRYTNNLYIVLFLITTLIR